MKANNSNPAVQRTKGEWIYQFSNLLNSGRISCEKKTICIMYADAGTTEEDKANAEYIVKAVNAHEKLIEVLKKVAEWELPETGRFWDNSENYPMSYEAANGTHGVRDYFKALATEALNNIESK